MSRLDCRIRTRGEGQGEEAVGMLVFINGGSEMKFKHINGEGVKRCLKAFFCISGANHDI